MRIARVMAVSLALLALAALSGVARPEHAKSAAADEQSTVTVTGSGSIETAPDEAIFNFGVLTKGGTAREALAANSAEARRLITALLAAGIDRKDVRTQFVSLSPRTSEDGQTILGYTAQNSVSTTIRELAKAGTVVDAAVAAGANEVDGPALVKEDQDRLYRNALEDAYKDAHAKAQALATASGRSLGRIQSISESSGNGPIVMAREAALAASTPIEPGSQQLQATVSVTYVLQ